MDKRNEYRIRPSMQSAGWWVAEFRAPRFWGGWSAWKEIDCYFGEHGIKQAEAMCRAHAGQGTINLGRLP